MALRREKFSEIPVDAVILSEEEALRYQWNIIENWKKSGDTWIFKHSYGILSAMTALTSMYINNHYRTKFRLLTYGRISSYLPVVIIPSIASALLHQQFVVRDVLLQKSCPVCVQLRSASIQSLLSTVFPAILAPSAALSFAIRYMTYNVPPITREPKKVFNMLYRHTKPIGNILLGIMLVQGLVAASITYQETKSFIGIQLKLNELDRKIQEEHNISSG